MGALWRGIAAGAVGSGIQNLYFKGIAGAGAMPEWPKGVFEPPEERQKSELSTVTVARRFTEGLAQRRLPEQRHPLAGQLVHYSFGAGWGGLYGLALESLPAAAGGPVGALAFGTMVWAVGDNTILPLFRLSAWPHKYPPQVHAFALGAHLAYGLGTWGGVEAAGAVAADGGRRGALGAVGPAAREGAPRRAAAGGAQGRGRHRRGARVRAAARTGRRRGAADLIDAEHAERESRATQPRRLSPGAG